MENGYNNGLPDFEGVKQYYDFLRGFIDEDMIYGVDYGVIPYTKSKTLFKPGADKLCRLFEIYPKYKLISNVQDYEKILFSFHYDCYLRKDKTIVAQASGFATSKEAKYSKKSPFDYSQIHTLILMAQKRGYIAAVTSYSGISSFFAVSIESKGNKTDWRKEAPEWATKQGMKKVDALALVSECSDKAQFKQKVEERLNKKLVTV